MRILFLLLVIFMVNSCIAQINPADSTVQVVGYWNKNEKHSYSFRFEKFKVKDKDTTMIHDIRYNGDLEVVDSTKTSYTFNWKYKQYSFGNVTGRQITDNGISGLIKLFENQPIKFETDENGSFKTLLNWEELRDKIRTAFDALKNTSELSPEISFLLQQPLDKQSIENAILKDVQLFYLFYGIKLHIGVPVEQQIDTGSSLTGPIKSDTSLLLTNIDFNEKFYNLTYYQGFDAESITRLSATIALLLAGTDSSQSMQASEKKDVEVLGFEDFYEATIHDSGWPLKMTYYRVVSLQDSNQVIERRTITLLE